MNNLKPTVTLSDYAALVRRRRVYFIALLPSTVLLAVFLAYALPASYRSTATILLEPSSIPADLVRTTVTSYADEQIELVRRRVMTRDRLAELVKKIDPYPTMANAGWGEKAQRVVDDTVIEKVDPVTLQPLAESDAFSINYNNPNPKLAVDVAQRLANLFLDFDRITRTENASETYNFLLAQSNQLDQSIREIEQKLAVFKRVHSEALPEEQKRNQDNLERTQRDLDSLEADVRLAEQREALLALQKNQVSPTLVGAVQDTPTQIATLKAQLADAQQRYTPNHPDIKRLQRAIEALQAQMSSTLTTKTSVPDNPEYLRISSDLEASRREVAALRARADVARATIRSIDSRLVLSPAVERDYGQLERDHEIAQSQFEDVQKKLKAAEFSKALESEQRGARYTLIRVPSTPTTPFSPNRLGVILVGIILGVGLAAGLAVFADSSDPFVRSRRDVLELEAISTIGNVPIIESRADHRRGTRRFAAVVIAYTLAVVLVGLTVTYSLKRTHDQLAHASSNS